MTEAEWLVSHDPERILRLIRFGNGGKLSASLARLFGRRRVAEGRKIQLFGQACMHRVGLTDSHFQQAGQKDAKLLTADPVRVSRMCLAIVATNESLGSGDGEVLVSGYGCSTRVRSDSINAPAPADFLPSAREVAVVIAEGVAQCAFLRDIFGNPFRPVAVDPSWRTSTAVEIANGMYDTSDFSPMPILADALQDAGCENTDILDHCRGPGPHVRGCWVVDLVLGKE